MKNVSSAATGWTERPFIEYMCEVDRLLHERYSIAAEDLGSVAAGQEAGKTPPGHSEGSANCVLFFFSYPSPARQLAPSKGAATALYQIPLDRCSDAVGYGSVVSGGENMNMAPCDPWADHLIQNRSIFMYLLSLGRFLTKVSSALISLEVKISASPITDFI